MDIQVFRRKIVAGKYQLTQHAKDEAADDNLDISDIESIILNGEIHRVLTRDPRGKRYVIRGMTVDKLDGFVVCRILSSGKLRINSGSLQVPPLPFLF